MRKDSISGDTLRLSRRELLAKLGQFGAASLLAAGIPTSVPQRRTRAGAETVAAAKESKLSEADEQLLEELERAIAPYFWEQASSRTGLVKDRSRADGGADPRDVASIAATGFGLTALAIADHRNYIPHEKAQERVRATLRFFWKRLEHNHGFFYHWLNAHTGERMWESEFSSIDTAILLCGALTCRQHFTDAEIQDLARRIYERVDWPWLLAGGKTLSHGWRPETGFLKARWDTYSEHMMIYLLGLGSPTHPLLPETWHAWARPIWEFEGLRYIGSRAPLFVHQYSHAWFDFRGRRDRYADYFHNSIIATQVHRRFCLELRKQFPQFSEDLWGITASDSARGYVVWGGPPPIGPIDGTVVPAAAGGSIPFLPTETLRALRTMRERYTQRAWKRYGLVDAFNPHTNWFDTDVIGINLGILLLMAENARTGFVWNTFMKNPEMPAAMAAAGFH